MLTKRAPDSFKHINNNKPLTNDVLAKTPTKVQLRLFGRSADCARPGTPPETGVRTSAPARRTSRRTHAPPGAGTYRNSPIQQPLRGAMACEINATRRLAKHLHDLVVDGRPYSSSTLGPSPGVVAPKDCVGEVGLRRDPVLESGDQPRSAVRPQKQAKIPLTEGSLP